MQIVKKTDDRRDYPRVAVGGEANIFLEGVARNGTMLRLSPTGLQIECRHKLIEQLTKSRSSSGLYPEFELEFALPINGRKNARTVLKNKRIKTTCNVSFCRRQKQDSYHLGLHFISLADDDKEKLSQYINGSAAA